MLQALVGYNANQIGHWLGTGGLKGDKPHLGDPLNREPDSITAELVDRIDRLFAKR